ncbi:MAG: protease inhibitor I42 family protein [Akkermansia sp.]|nr:protease inhibitor I42 family protein [Akkermansia sp.]
MIRQILPYTVAIGLCSIVYGIETEESQMKADLEVGGVKQIELPSNPSTGYKWELAIIMDDSEPIKVEVTKKIPEEKIGIIGAGGLTVITIKGINPGNAQCILEYKRPWEKDKAPVKRVTVDVSVKK